MADKITGYRELSEDEVALINEVKQKLVEFGDLVDKVQNSGVEIDGRWLSIAKMHFQEGGMAAVRSIAKPETF